MKFQWKILWLRWLTAMMCGLILPGVSAAPKLAPGAGTPERLLFNHPGLSVDLGVGLWAFPFPVDIKGDGNWDLMVACVDRAYEGMYLFENPRNGEDVPVFKPGVRVGPGGSNLQVSYVDGIPRLLKMGTEFPDFINSGTENGQPLGVGGWLVPGRGRTDRWSLVDYDGDGDTDVVLGLDSWEDYGWRDTFDEEGNWTKGPLRGKVFIIRNNGTDAAPKYQKAFRIDAGGEPLETFGSPSPAFADFRGTGKLDLICGEFLDSFTYYENLGTRSEPRYAAGGPLRTAEGEPIRMHLQMIMPVTVDWDHDGFPDLVVGEEDGRVALVRNTGTRLADGSPAFEPPLYFQQQAHEVKLGALDHPIGVDWNGDGSIDILSGDTAGQIQYLENLSEPGVERPKWAAPVLLEAGGEPFRIMAGPKGSLQGPAEAKWGYTTFSVADWDGDGLLDIVLNSIWGKVVWLKNIGTATEPELAAARPVEVEWEGAQPRMDWGWLEPEGKALLTQWRTTPVAVDFTGNGLTDLICVDTQGVLCLFTRYRDDQGVLRLGPPKRVLVYGSGAPIKFMDFSTDPPKGYVGCKKFHVTDWDGDGRLDILFSNHPVQWLRQVGKHEDQIIFNPMGQLVDADLGSHDPAPGTADFNADGIPDLLMGCEGGQVYYMRNPRSTEE